MRDFAWANESRFAPANLESNVDVPGFDEVVKALKEDDQQRVNFLKACLLKLGLQVNEEQNAVPSLSRLHLSSSHPSGTVKILESLRDIISSRDGQNYLEDENDTFLLETPTAWSLSSLADDLPAEKTEKAKIEAGDMDKIIDYDKVVKRLVVHDADQPRSKDTPYFNHQAFFSNLEYYEGKSAQSSEGFGKNLLYGEVVTSTNTLLEK